MICRVSPDKGGEKRARKLADYLKTDCVFLHKERHMDGGVKIKRITGDAKGRCCIIVDDIVDSAETLTCTAKVLKEVGASSIEAYVIHAVLSEGSIEKLEQSNVSSLTVTDTINQRLTEKIRVLGVSEILAKAIKPE